MPTKAGDEGDAARLLALAAEAEPHLSGTDSATWMDRLERDHDGLRKAFSWFIDHGKGAEALQLAGNLWQFQEVRGHADESRAWLAKALAAPGAEAGAVARARALYGAGILAFRKLDEREAQRAFEECLAIARELGDAFFVVKGATGLARVALRRGDTRKGRKWAEEALAVARNRGERGDAATPLHMLAAMARVEGDFGKAKAFYRENLALNRELRRPQWVSTELCDLGALEVLEGNIAEAVPLLREGLQMAHEEGDKYGAPYDHLAGARRFREGGPSTSGEVARGGQGPVRRHGPRDGPRRGAGVREGTGRDPRCDGRHRFRRGVGRGEGDEPRRRRGVRPRSKVARHFFSSRRRRGRRSRPSERCSTRTRSTWPANGSNSVIQWCLPQRRRGRRRRL